MGREDAITISVVIPAYNNGRYIGRAIDSVLAQTHPADEIIVVDDGSTDNTAEVVTRYGATVQYVSQENAGASAARNAGIRAAGSSWIALLDGDDEWLPDKLKWQVELLQRNPHLVWMTGNYHECLCEENRSAVHTAPGNIRHYLDGKEFFESYLDAFQKYIWGHTDCMLIRRDVFDEVGYFCADLPKANDIDMWLRIAYRYPAIGFLAEPTAIYHLSVSDSISKKHRTLTIFRQFVERHYAIARREGVQEQLIPAAGAMMRRWIRGMLFESRKQEIRELIDTFPEAFSMGYRRFIYLLTVFPNMTARMLRLFSHVIRVLKLRRRVVPATK